MPDPSPFREMTSHNNLHSLLYQTTSAEYIALCTQTYQLARHALLERLGEGTYRNPAIVFDLDETVLDNSPYQKWLVAAGANFHEPTTWREWCNAGEAGAVPGALEFVKFAEGLDPKVTPLFITSRENVTRLATARNLHRLGLLTDDELAFEMKYPPDKDGHQPPEHAAKTRLFMKKMGDVPLPFPSAASVSLDNKFDQRVYCERTRRFEIVLSIGDSLGDYAEYYGRVYDKTGKRVGNDHPTLEARRTSVWQDIRLFGREFILLPNATYGSWLRALEANGRGASDELAETGNPVRKPLKEPGEPFHYGAKDPADATATKLESVPGIWAPGA